MPKQSPPLRIQKPTVQLWWFTAVLIAINVGLFLWQIITGVDVSQPSTQDAILWGADYAPLSFLAEPFRLFSSMFFHFGILHLMLNMWALYIFGSIAEQLFGRSFYIGLYLFAGLMGSLLSGYLDIQHSLQIVQQGVFQADLMPRVSAGASGAVMGLGAALTTLSLLPVLKSQMFILDKKTLLMVMGLNLFIGFSISGINNAAHIGGMLMGVLLALLWYIAEKRLSHFMQMAALILAAAICIGFYVYCQHLVTGITPFWQQVLAVMQQQLNA